MARFNLHHLLVVGLLAALAAPVAAQFQDPIPALKRRIVELQNEGDFGVQNFRLCASIEGYGRYTPLDNDRLPQGSTLYVYYEPRNLFTAMEDGRYRLHYTQDVLLYVIIGGSEQPIFRQQNMLTFDYTSDKPVLDVFATNELDLAQLPPGTYLYRAVLKDQLRPDQVAFEGTFQIVPPPQ
ncbi:MAG: hypothetical protein ACFCBW_21815 [Candidatus Competibacterales bacterium]